MSGFEDVPEIGTAGMEEFFWREDAWLGGSIGFGGRSYHEVVYRDDLEDREELASKMFWYLHDPWVGTKEMEYGLPGHLRYRDFAAIILADLTDSFFSFVQYEHPYERDQRIAALIREVGLRSPQEGL